MDNEIGDTGEVQGASFRGKQARNLHCGRKRKRNSRKKKSTPSIQNDKTPKQPKKNNFQESLNFKQCEKALNNVRGRKRQRFVFLY
jgi:hypothetical protein